MDENENEKINVNAVVTSHRFCVLTNKPRVTQYIKSFSPDYVGRSIDMECFEDSDGVIHDWLNGLAGSEEDLTLEVYGPYGSVLYTMEFQDVKLAVHEINFDYSDNNLAVHKLLFVYNRVIRHRNSAKSTT